MGQLLASNQQSPLLHSKILDKLRKIESLSRKSQKLTTVRWSQLMLIHEEVNELEYLLKQRVQSPQGTDMDKAPAHFSLTPKEKKLINLFAKGFSYQESAEHLDCKISTIQTHAKHIYKKLGVHSRAEAVHEALLAELLQP